MPSILTKSQRKKLKEKNPAMYKRREKIIYKNLWQYAFVGEIPYKDLCKAYGIIYDEGS